MFNSTLKSVMLMLGLLVTTACATQVSNMVPPVVSVAHSFEGGASVRVTGADAAIASNEKIKAAIEQAAQQSMLFRSTQPNTYTITARILSIENPLLGANLTSKVRASWTLTDAGKSEVIWREQIVSERTAQWNEHFVAAKRLAIANEKAIAANIEQAIAAMARVASNNKAQTPQALGAEDNS